MKRYTAPIDNLSIIARGPISRRALFKVLVKNRCGAKCDTPNCREFCVESYSGTEIFVLVAGENVDHFKNTKVSFRITPIK